MTMDFLKKIAPTLAAALAGPAAGIAVEAVGRAFGWDESTKEKVETLLTDRALNSEDVAKIKTAELALVQKEKELGFKFAELAALDAQAAHKEQQETIRSGDNAEDPYVRHTRPLMARQSWYGMGVYILGMEAWKALDPGVQGASFELAAIIGAPGLAYIGFRSMFDKGGLLSAFSRKPPASTPGR